MKKFISVILITVVALLTLCSCKNIAPSDTDGMNIICTTFPQYDYLKNIIGSEENLTLLVDNGGDLHSYEPTAQDIIKISSADLFVYVGGNSDNWVEATLKSANNPDLKSIALTDIVETHKEEYVAGMERDEHNEHAAIDEHVWLSLKNAATITQVLCDAVCEIDKENEQVYKANAAEYIAQLNALDIEYQAVISNSKRNTLVFADRFPFRYLVEDYNLEYYAAFAGCSSESEASFKTMSFLIDKTAELNVPVVLTIDGSDGSLAKTVCNETGVKSAELDSCQSVSSADIKNGTTYINIMKSNLKVLRQALN